MVRANLHTIPLERGSHQPNRYGSLFSSAGESHKPNRFGSLFSSADPTEQLDSAEGVFQVALAFAVGAESGKADTTCSEADTTCSAFWEAAKKSEPKELRAILSRLPDQVAREQLLQKCDKNGRTALHQAARCRASAETLQVLIDSMASPESREKLLWQTDSDDESTALHLACLNAATEAVGVLLKAMPSNEAREKILHTGDRNQQTPLHLAARAREGAEVVQLLLAALPSQEARRRLTFASDNRAGTALTSAAARDAPETIRRLSEAMPNREETFENWKQSYQTDKKTPLHSAVFTGCCEQTISALLEMLPDQHARVWVLKQTDMDDNTPLHLAAWGGVTPAALELMLTTLPTPGDREQALHEPNGCAQTPLALAALNGHEDLCRIMSEYAKLTCEDVTTALWQDGPGGFIVTNHMAEEVDQLEDFSAKRFWPVMYISDEARVISGKGCKDRVCLSEDTRDLMAPPFLRFFIENFGETLGHQRVLCSAHMVPLRLLQTPDIVGALADTPNRKALETTFAKLAVAYWWDHTKSAYYLNIALVFCRLLIVVNLTATLRERGYLPGLQRLWLLFPLAMCLRDATNEVAQCGFVIVRWQESTVHKEKSKLLKTLLGIWTYLGDYSNINDACLNLIGFCAIYFIWAAPEESEEPRSHFKRNSDHPTPKAIVALWTALLWVSVLQELRGIRRIGLRLLPILKAVQDIGGFALTLALTLAGAVHAYFILAFQEDNPGSYFYAAFFPVWRLTLLGDFDISHLEGGASEDGTPRHDFYLAHIFFFIISTCVTVVLMNIFIGVLSSNFDNYAQQSEALLLRARAEIITDFQTKLLPLLARKCKRLFRLVGPKDEVKDEDCLVIFQMKEDDSEADNGLWEELRNLALQTKNDLDCLRREMPREELSNLALQTKKDLDCLRREMPREELRNLALQTKSDLDCLRKEMQEARDDGRKDMAELMALLKASRSSVRRKPRDCSRATPAKTESGVLAGA